MSRLDRPYEVLEGEFLKPFRKKTLSLTKRTNLLKKKTLIEKELCPLKTQALVSKCDVVLHTYISHSIQHTMIYK